MGRRRAAAVAAVAASCLELSVLGHDGAGSVGSGSACGALSDGDTDDVQIDKFERRIDALFEKRGSTREKALESLADMLRAEYRIRDCTAHSDTLTSRCLAALKRGSSLESVLASQLLSLLIITRGQPDHSLFLALRPELERAAVQYGSCCGDGGAVVQCAALDCLALAAFVLAEEEEDTWAIMQRLRSLWGKGDPKVRTAAVRGWSFLLTSLGGDLDAALGTAAAAAAPGTAPGAGRSTGGKGRGAARESARGGAYPQQQQQQQGSSELGACLVALAGLMSQRDLDLRTAAGEAVAVVQSCCGCSAEEMQALAAEAAGGGGGEEEDEEEVEEEGAGGGSRRGSRSGEGSRRDSSSGGGGGSDVGDVDCLLGRMQELAGNKGDALRRSRRDRALQRSTFRGLLGALSGAALPCCRIRLQHGDCLRVEGVAGNHRLAFLRRVLAGGFQAHLQRNPLLHAVFGFSPRTERPERMGAAEKRLTRSSHSAGARARTTDRRWSRDAKTASRMAGYVEL